MYQRQESPGYDKHRRGKKKQAARTKQASQIHTEGSDEHDRSVEGAVEPGTSVVADSGVTFEVRPLSRKHASSKGDKPGPNQNAESPQQRPGRNFRGKRKSGGPGDLCGCRSD